MVAELAFPDHHLKKLIQINTLFEQVQSDLTAERTFNVFYNVLALVVKLLLDLGANLVKVGVGLVTIVDEDLAGRHFANVGLS